MLPRIYREGRDMIDRKQALVDLRDKVKAGEVTGTDCCIASTMGWFGQTEHHIAKSFHGSLDAAKALHEAVIPGFFVDISHWSMHEPMSIVTVGNDFKGNADTIARAWLLAIIEALIMQEDET